MEDCCGNKGKKMDKKEILGKKISQNTKTLFLWGFIAILVVVVLYVIFFSGSSESAVSAGKTAGQVAQQNYGGMVGGC